MDGKFLDRALTSKQRNAYTSVLFYASWCPFSRSMLLKFDMLSSMFPQIKHLALEQSSAHPRWDTSYLCEWYACSGLRLVPQSLVKTWFFFIVITWYSSNFLLISCWRSLSNTNHLWPPVFCLVISMPCLFLQYIFKIWNPQPAFNINSQPDIKGAV